MQVVLAEGWARKGRDRDSRRRPATIHQGAACSPLAYRRAGSNRLGVAASVRRSSTTSSCWKRCRASPRQDLHHTHHSHLSWPTNTVTVWPGKVEAPAGGDGTMLTASQTAKHRHTKGILSACSRASARAFTASSRACSSSPVMRATVSDASAVIASAWARAVASSSSASSSAASTRLSAARSASAMRALALVSACSRRSAAAASAADTMLATRPGAELSESGSPPYS